MTDLPHEDVWQRQAAIVRSIKSLTRATNRNSRELKRHSEVIDTLNGGVDALKVLKTIVPELKQLASYSSRIILLAEAKNDDEAFWRGLKRRINPLKPVGLVIWTIVIAAISGTAYELTKFIIAGNL